MSEEVIVHRLIIPPEEAEKLVLGAGDVYLRDCPCRTQMKKCPPEKWEVCMLFEHASEEDRQKSKWISTEEALRIVKMTSARGDIHQVFYFDEGQRPFELCNCCTCCCYPLREAKEENNNFKGQLRSGYIALTDPDLCMACGECVDSCFFEARQLDSDVLRTIDALCYGCGRCIIECPEGAIQLAFDPARGVPIPAV